jgi:hypothetical protein
MININIYMACLMMHQKIVHLLLVQQVLFNTSWIIHVVHQVLVH